MAKLILFLDSTFYDPWEYDVVKNFYSVLLGFELFVTLIFVFYESAF